MKAQLEDVRNDRQFRALTGMTRHEFDQLLPVFTESYQALRQEAYENVKENRHRRPGGGPKGKLVTMGQKLFFILIYWKVYPSYDVLGFMFDMDHSKACTNVQALWPVLKRTLETQEVLPARQFTTFEELRAAFADISELFIDATERPQARPQDDTKQRQAYSGKKKRHTAKNTIIATACKWILFLGYTVAGSVHDYRRLKEEFALPEEEGDDALAKWFEDFILWLDLGYLGAQKTYAAKAINMPHKKPRTSKANPNPSLTAEQKADNRHISQRRVIVEQAIGGLKRFGILMQTFRNRMHNFVDEAAVIGAGLWNWKLKCQGIAY